MLATFMAFAEKTNLALHKMAAMSTDGASSMIGKKSWIFSPLQTK